MDPAGDPKGKSSVASALKGDDRPWPLKVVGSLVSRIVILPVAATMIAALALMLYGLTETWRYVQDLFFAAERLHGEAALLHAIEIVDLFLLATVVQVVSLGLYQLYFKQDLAVPRWLKIETLDDLKSKLVGVVITVLAVFFLGQAVTWKSGPDILYLGGAVALVIVGLTYFLSKIDHD